jgi:hypothetical protein
MIAPVTSPNIAEEQITAEITAPEQKFVIFGVFTPKQIHFNSLHLRNLVYKPYSII